MYIHTLLTTLCWIWYQILWLPYSGIGAWLRWNNLKSTNSMVFPLHAWLRGSHRNAHDNIFHRSRVKSREIFQKPTSAISLTVRPRLSELLRIVDFDGFPLEATSMILTVALGPGGPAVASEQNQHSQLIFIRTRIWIFLVSMHQMLTPLHVDFSSLYLCSTT
jgi:hypothetical protein